MNSKDVNAILATQKNMMSYPVTNTFVGKYLFISSVSDGQPSVLNGQSALLNHVSKTSLSCTHPGSFGASNPT